MFGVDFGFGNIMLREKSTAVGATGTRYIIKFAATSTTHTIKFTNWGHICTSCAELILDNVRLYTLEQLEPTIPPCAVDVTEISTLERIDIFPNPVTDEFKVESTKFEVQSIKIYNMLGLMING